MKRLLTVAAASLLAASVYADAADDALLGAQSAYRAALKAQTDNDSKIIYLQTELNNAQARLTQAQADISRLQGELQNAQAVKTQQASVLQQAGERLDSAWNAVYGVGGTRAGQ
ncbi:hypothetical protein [Neisseria animalis]|uniref:Periplasmic protein n=1 Tax=Neisseria animalis TaxID=492 RepID=A0A5P3MSR4_NEIAN|nr:hypothetical protein [Neisseria animalis]QEY23831.1 hypothetical protein D0T90_04360 [Neisseria animalis]ROW32102.1 hypothetical protein CGZ60_07175 [Neisseria animalis]VEE09814.1 Putative periplasmic protein [Neisseria animalis]